jgi:hypothetical protein
MNRFVGQKLNALLEEKFSAQEDCQDSCQGSFWLGRLYCHAPEVDGAAVFVCKNAPEPQAWAGVPALAGDIVPCKVTARRGFDLEVMSLIEKTVKRCYI